MLINIIDTCISELTAEQTMKPDTFILMIDDNNYKSINFLVRCVRDVIMIQ